MDITKQFLVNKIRRTTYSPVFVDVVIESDDDEIEVLFRNSNEDVQILRMTPEEALNLLSRLSTQLKGHLK